MFGTCGANCRVLKARQVFGAHALHGFQDIVSVVGIFQGTHPLSGSPYPNNSKAVFPNGSGFAESPVYWEPNWSLTADPSAWGEWSETRRWLRRIITVTSPNSGEGDPWIRTIKTETIDRWTGQYVSNTATIGASNEGNTSLIETPTEANYPTSYPWGSGLNLNIRVFDENSFSDAMDRLINAVDSVDLELIDWGSVNNFYQILKGFDASGNVTTSTENNLSFLRSNTSNGFSFDQYPPTKAFTAIGCAASRTDKGATLVYGKLHVLTTDNVCYFNESREGSEYVGGGSGGFYTPGSSELAQHYNSTCDGGTCSMPAFSGPASVYRFEPDVEAARDYQRTLDYNGLRIHMNCNGPAACKVIGDQPS